MLSISNLVFSLPNELFSNMTICVHFGINYVLFDLFKAMLWYILPCRVHQMLLVLMGR
jgi:hypothetical protein